jgi:type I restriction enzyme M protein
MDIKSIRAALELTQEQLAHKLGVSFVTISRWELGKSKPSSLALQAIAKLERQAIRSKTTDIAAS